MIGKLHEDIVNTHTHTTPQSKSQQQSMEGKKAKNTLLSIGTRDQVAQALCLSFLPIQSYTTTEK